MEKNLKIYVYIYIYYICTIYIHKYTELNHLATQMKLTQYSKSTLCVCVCVCVCESLSHVQPVGTAWTLGHQVLLSMEFSRQELACRVTIPFSRGSSQPRDRTRVSCTAGIFFII